MYIYHALINALSAHMIHINLHMIFYTHIYIHINIWYKYYIFIPYIKSKYLFPIIMIKENTFELF